MSKLLVTTTAWHNGQLGLSTQVLEFKDKEDANLAYKKLMVAPQNTAMCITREVVKLY